MSTTDNISVIKIEEGYIMSEHNCHCNHDKNHEHNCHHNHGADDLNCNRGSMVNICNCGCGHGKDEKPNPKSATNNQWS